MAQAEEVEGGADEDGAAEQEENIMSRYELMFGAISVVMICRVPRPLSRATSTNSRVFSENVWARTARAAHGHDVSPIRIASVA